MTPDVNVLVAAALDDHPHHLVAADWLRQARVQSLTARHLTLLPMVAIGAIRVLTNARIFSNPVSADEATAFVEAVQASPGVMMLSLGGEWRPFTELIAASAPQGGAVQDAWIAAAVRHHGECLVTFDRGFRRYLADSELVLLPPATPSSPSP